MKPGLAYVTAFGLALASAMAGYYVGFLILMSGSGFGIAGFFAVVVVLPMLAAYGVFVISYAAFADHWIGWLNGLVGAVLVILAGLFFFALIAQDILEEELAAILMVITLFAGGYFIMRRLQHD